MYFLRKTFQPEIFQGKHQRKNYFEGWYYKLIDSSVKNVIALIPGVSFGKDKKDSHAFIQVLDAQKCKTYYLRYDLGDFRFNERKFEVEIGDNYFSDREIRLNIENEDVKISGRIVFENIVAFPKTIVRPGIMGPYAFIPFMECYHGIVNIHHELAGQLRISGTETDFSNGYGYIEKDWGSSFPESWVWLQSNHFSTGDISVMFSVAKIPWMGRHFMGFISFLRIKDKIMLFSTYSKAKIVAMRHEENKFKVIMADRHRKMELEAIPSAGGILKAPKNGLMNRDILETITAVVRIKLTDTEGRIIYEGEGLNTGMEIAGDIFKYYAVSG